MDFKASSEEATEPLAGLRVLVAEDEAIIAMELEAMLEDRGATVVGPAATLPAAATLASGQALDGAILDLRLGRHPISTVAHILHDRAIPFIFYSGQAKSDPLIAEWQNCPLLPKPSRADSLVSALLREIAAAQAAPHL